MPTLYETIAEVEAARASGACQEKLRLPLPVVEGNVDYATQERLLREMDAVLVSSGIEDRFCAQMVEARRLEAGKQGHDLSEADQLRAAEHARRTLRCNIARIMNGEAHRVFSLHLAESTLLQWFCRYDAIDGLIHVAGKSTLQRMAEEMDVPAVRKLVEEMVSKAGSKVEDATGKNGLGLEEPMGLDEVFIDSTCLELDIHYPTDWVLLRDAVRSMTQSIVVIRSHGLRHRIGDPQRFMRDMNQLAIQMARATGTSGSKKARKRILRAMKRQVGVVKRHGERYLQLLMCRWQETDLSQRQMEAIAKRLSKTLEQVPQAVKQAHERIIGERKVANADKILSLPEEHAALLVRGKAGKRVEFGLQCTLGESRDGLIVDWDLPGDHTVADAQALVPAMQRLAKAYGEKTVKTVVTDRGFASHANSTYLDNHEITDRTMPRDPRRMAEALEDPDFGASHRRRAQTEGRIGIFKSCFAGAKIPCRGLENQKKHVAWSVLAHNTWVIARRRIKEADARASSAA